MKQITKEWLDRASDDLDSIKLLLKKAHLTNVVSFHAQQAVEKTFKSVIEELEIGFVKTHHLDRLYELIRPHNILPDIDLDVLDQLDSVYTESRYPNEMGLLPYGKPTIEESRRFYSFAKELYLQIKAKLEVINLDHPRK